VSPMLKVLVVTGSSGGHIFPALAFLDTLGENKGIETLLVLPRKNILKSACNQGHKTAYISISSIGLSPGLKNLVKLIGFFKGTLESAYILLRFRPHIAVGFGSITSVPLLVFARVLGIKVLIHEQNVIAGRANSFLAGLSDRIAVSFPESRGYFKVPSERIVFTGNPLRRGLVEIDKIKALDFFALERGKFTILVSGGSQGSQSVNLGFLKAISGLTDKSRFQVVHITGDRDLSETQKRYASLGASARCLGFLDQMQYAYSCCDLIVSRGGATTIAEIIYFHLAAIIIPYPYAYRHQLANARVLAKRGVARIINDDALGTDRLKDTLQGFLDNPGEIRAMSSFYADFSAGESKHSLAQAVLSLGPGSGHRGID